MLLLRALLLWALVSVHVVGGAMLFRRLFAGESAWFGFIVPALAFCLGLNFIEHFVALAVAALAAAADDPGLTPARGTS